MADGSNHHDTLKAIASYLPFLALPVRYLFVGFTEYRWFAPANFAFGWPFTLTSFGVIVAATIYLFFDQPLRITERRLIVSCIAVVIWIGVFFLQVHIQRGYRRGRERLQWIFVIEGNILAIGTYFLFIKMMSTITS